MESYSPIDNLLLVNGAPIQGYDEGDDVITIERSNPSASHKVGIDGEMTVSRTADKSATFTFRVMQSSASNAFLSGLLNAQENAPFVPVSVQFKNLVTNELVVGTQGYMMQQPTVTRGETAQANEWTIVVEDGLFSLTG